MNKLLALPIEMLSVERHTSSLAEQSSVPDWWQPLHKAVRNEVVFLSKDWIETWLETYGTRFEGKWLSWSHNGKVVGGCLILIKRIRIGMLFFRTIFLNASGTTLDRSPLAEYNDVLCIEGFEDVIANDLIALLSELKWDRFALTACSNDGIVGRIVAAIPAAEAKIEHKPAPFIKFADLSDAPFDSRLSSNTRSQIRRSRRIYEAVGGPITVAPAQTLESAMQYFEEMTQMHNARWASKGLAGSFSNRLAIGFHRKLIRRIWASGMVDLLYVKAGDTRIGVLYNFVCLGRVYFFQSGLAYQKNNKLKPGLLTHCLAIENYRSRGLVEYDFLAGDSRYKRALATHERSLLWATIFGSTIAGRLLSLTNRISAALRTCKAKLKSATSGKSGFRNLCLGIYSLLNLDSTEPGWLTCFTCMSPALS